MIACTDTAGYISDHEIGQILAQNPSAQDLWDANSYSNIVVFNDTQWVAYMDADNKATRKALYLAHNFLGSADWAVDLQSGSKGGDDSSSDSSYKTVYVDPDIWNAVSPRVTAPPGVTLIWPPMPLSTPTTITFAPWTTSVTYSSLTTSTKTLSDGSMSTYPAYVFVSWLTVLSIPPVMTTAIPVWGISLDTSSTNGVIILTSSVQPPPFTVTITPVMSGTESVIGATETTTSSGAVIIRGSETYSQSVQTQTKGESTTIIGGVTLPPVVVTVTPNPHPITTPTPGTTDPVINSKTISWTSSGTTAEPTAAAGCIGCGTICLLFCNPACPFCPPGAFSDLNSSGSSSDPNDDDDDDDDEDATYTIMFDSMADDAFPTAFVTAADLSSIYSEQESMFSSLFSLSTTSTSKTSTSTTTKTTELPTPTPTADGMFWDMIFFYTFEIYNIEGWAMDGGDSLHDEERGCGALTGWDWNNATSDTAAYVYFNLPFFMKLGCVERAIVSAGGPSISCDGQGLKKREADDAEDPAALPAGPPVRRDGLTPGGKVRMEPAFPPYTEAQLQEFEDYYKNIQPTPSQHSHVPITWGGHKHDEHARHDGAHHVCARNGRCPD
ncbi:hypothetical protein QQX98_007037 [Neonectria punicea]|uniref:Uncharacterized protein n=1 Tax=Neonectria punicea TaxID=979145 RepID=A0ABR1GZP3_9HYPO